MRSFHDIFADVQEIERVREGVAVLMKDDCHRAVIGFEYVTSRILWVKLKFSRVEFCVVAVHDQTEGEVEEREKL